MDWQTPAEGGFALMISDISYDKSGPTGQYGERGGGVRSLGGNCRHDTNRDNHRPLAGSSIALGRMGEAILLVMP